MTPGLPNIARVATVVDAGLSRFCDVFVIWLLLVHLMVHSLGLDRILLPVSAKSVGFPAGRLPVVQELRS